MSGTGMRFFTRGGQFKIKYASTGRSCADQLVIKLNGNEMKRECGTNGRVKTLRVNLGNGNYMLNLLYQKGSSGNSSAWIEEITVPGEPAPEVPNANTITFENENLGGFNWRVSGDKGWERTNNIAYDGLWSWKPAELAVGESSGMKTEFTTEGGTIKFQANLSSTTDARGNCRSPLIMRLNGADSWTLCDTKGYFFTPGTTLSAGTYTLEFIYTKHSNEDPAQEIFIDNLIIPGVAAAPQPTLPGLIDFEDDSLGGYAWRVTGELGWLRTQQNAYRGDWAWQPSQIDVGQSSGMLTSFQANGADPLVFRARLVGEYDDQGQCLAPLIVYIDGQELFNLCDTGGNYGTYTIRLPRGEFDIEFSYEKHAEMYPDHGVWVDNIQLPVE